MFLCSCVLVFLCSCVFIAQAQATVELDYMEYADDAAAQAAYVTSDTGTDLVPDMTNYTDPSGEVFYSSQHASYPAWRAFDDDFVNHGWITLQYTVIGYIGYDFGVGNSKNITRYTITAPLSGYTTRAPRDWTFEGSDNADFNPKTILHTVGSGGAEGSQTGWTAVEKRTFDFENNTSYRYYRLNITANNGDTNYLSITEIEMMRVHLKSILRTPSNNRVLIH